MSSKQSKYPKRKKVTGMPWKTTQPLHYVCAVLLTKISSPFSTWYIVNISVSLLKIKLFLPENLLDFLSVSPEVTIIWEILVRNMLTIILNS